MKALKQQLDDLERALQYHNDLCDQVLVIEASDDFCEEYPELNLDWDANYSLPGQK